MLIILQIYDFSKAIEIHFFDNQKNLISYIQNSINFKLNILMFLKDVFSSLQIESFLKIIK